MTTNMNQHGIYQRDAPNLRSVHPFDRFHADCKFMGILLFLDFQCEPTRLHYQVITAYFTTLLLFTEIATRDDLNSNDSRYHMQRYIILCIEYLILYVRYVILYHIYLTLTSKHLVFTFSKNQPSRLGQYFRGIQFFSNVSFILVFG